MVGLVVKLVRGGPSLASQAIASPEKGNSSIPAGLARQLSILANDEQFGDPPPAYTQQYLEVLLEDANELIIAKGHTVPSDTESHATISDKAAGESSDDSLGEGR